MSQHPIHGWIPGVLSDKQIKRLLEKSFLTGEVHNLTVDKSSIDLTLSDEGFRMVSGAVKPFGKDYHHKILKNTQVAEPQQADSAGHFKLQPKQTYVFRLQQSLGSDLRDAGFFHGHATAKSSVGRVDVLARLIVDGMSSYECFHPNAIEKSNGQMFLEITPITFPVLVKKGISLSQLRIFCGTDEDAKMQGEVLYRSVIYNSEINDGCLTADLSNVPVNDSGESGCAFEAKFLQDAEPIPLWEEPGIAPDPHNYWELIQAKEVGNRTVLPIKKESFYILRSKEQIALPGGIAVYCRAIDETIGEMRIHYAGFVHPTFGFGEPGQGTPLIFEVRGHDVEVLLSDGERMAHLTFYRMSADCEGKEDSAYGNQTLKLSKFFKPW